MSFSWTRLQGTPIWERALSFYGEPWRDYHGIWHLERIYHHAAETFGFAYDEDLDLAILAHDVMMDFDGRDELFSARWLRAQTDGAHPRAEALILTTKDHRPGPGDTRLARLDIAGFIDDAERREGARRLRAEAANRHLSDEDWINGTHAYLTGLLGRVAGGVMSEPQLEARDQWLRIMDGINASISEMEADWCGFGPEVGVQ